MSLHRFALLSAVLLLACAPIEAKPNEGPKDTKTKAPAKDAPAKDTVAPERRRPLDGEALRKAAYDPARLRERRLALLEGMPKGAIVVIAAPRHGAGDLFSYRPSPDFLYLSGQSAPRLVMLLAPDEDVLFAPPQDPRYQLWNGPRLAVGTELAKASGFEEVAPLASRQKRVKAALARHKGAIYLLGLEPKDLDLPKKTRAKSPTDRIHYLRQVKDTHELALLQRACDITAASLQEAARGVKPGQFEYEVEGVIEYMFRRYGAQRPGFASIVGSGPNSCVLHYSESTRRFRKGELIVMDVGAEFHGYTADITRTVPSSGRFSKRQREIYEIVLRAQAAGIKACVPGNTVKDVHRAAKKVIADAGYGKFFLHGTSHWLGLDVHDVGSYKRSIVPGMVLTVEPGIYLAKEALGVRIEDDILVTEKGPIVLSAGIPRDPDAIEAMMAGKGVGKLKLTPLPERKKSGKKPKKFFQLR